MLQLPQDLSDPQSHLDQLSEMFLGNPQPILTSLENKVKDFSAPGLSLCSLWKASPSWQDWVPRGTEHRFGDTPMFCSLLLAVFVPPLPHLLVL